MATTGIPAAAAIDESSPTAPQIQSNSDTCHPAQGRGLRGLNCPILYRLNWIAEDARGVVGRLDCQNREGKTWSLRYIIGNREIMEPW